MTAWSNSQSVLWGVVVSLAASSGAMGVSVEEAPSADAVSLIWLQLPNEGDAPPEAIAFDTNGWTGRFVLREEGALSVNDLLALRSVSLERRAAVSGAAARASAAAMAGSTLDGSGLWAAVALRAVYRAPADTEPQALEPELSSWYTPSVRSVPRRMKDLFVGATNRRWDDPYEEFLPSKLAERFAIYPSPGAAGLALIAGGCVLARRRR